MNRIIHKMNLFIHSIPQEPDNNQETTNSTPHVVETNFNIIKIHQKTTDKISSPEEKLGQYHFS